jgi:single-strand DNA-binding protein
VAFGATADHLAKYYTKGKMIIVSGRLQIRNYTDKDGNKRRAAEVVADNVYFGESRKSQEGNSTYHSQNGYQGSAGGFGNTEALVNELMAQKGQGDFYMLEDGDPQLPF